jgi:hypothetical protein
MNLPLIFMNLVQETIYGYVGWIFASHFLNRLGSEYTALAGILDPNNNSAHQEVLSKIKKRLRQDTYVHHVSPLKLCFLEWQD